MARLTGSPLRGALVTTCGMAFLLFGYDQGVLGGVLSLPSFKATFNNPGTGMQGIISGVYDLGCCFGAILAFVICEMLGRKRSILLGASTMIVGTILQASSFGRAQIIVARIVTGLGNGINTCVIPIWQAECLRPHNRGALLVIQTGLIAVGDPIASWLCYGTSYAATSVAWRLPIAFQAVFAIYVLCWLPFLPESPRWLIHHDRVDEAIQVLAALEGSNASIDTPSVIAQCNDIVSSVQLERDVGTASWTEVFHEGKMRNISRVLLAAGTQVMNQMSGINSIAYYLPITFEQNIGMSTRTSLLISGVLVTQYAIVAFLPYFFIERFGRRKLLMGSSAACSFCMVMIAVMLAINTKVTDWVFVAFSFIYFDVFSWGILPISWMYPSEITPLRTRNKGVAITVATAWILNFIVVIVTPTGISNLGYKLYIIWACFCASFIPITYFFYPETGRRSLEEIDQIFMNERFGVTHTRSPGTSTADQFQNVRIEKDQINESAVHCIETA